LENPALDQPDYMIRNLIISDYSESDFICITLMNTHNRATQGSYTLQTIKQTNPTHSELHVYNIRQGKLRNIVPNDPSPNF